MLNWRKGWTKPQSSVQRRQVRDIRDVQTKDFAVRSRCTGNLRDSDIRPLRSFVQLDGSGQRLFHTKTS